MKRLIFLFILFSVELAACTTSSTPRVIASFPRESVSEPHLISPLAEVIYTATMEMEVSNVETAVESAKNLVERYDGYMVSSQFWYQDERKLTSVVLAVSAPNYDNLHSAVLGLGKLLNESVTGQLVSYAPGGGTNTAHITIYFSSRAVSWPSLPSTGWNPGRTVRNAFQVFLTAFGFIADIVLWILIVLGPFVLMVWGAWTIVRKIRR